MTLRESLQAEIDAAKVDIAAKETKLLEMEQTASSWLGSEVDALKLFFASVKSHLGL